MDCSMPRFPVHHYFLSLPKPMSIESVMPSNHLILCHPLLLMPSIFPSIFSNELALCLRWLKNWSFSFSVSFQWTFRVDSLEDWLVWSPCYPRYSQESSAAPQFRSVDSLVLSLFYSQTLTSIGDYCKSHSYDHMDLCRQSDISAF